MMKYRMNRSVFAFWMMAVMLMGLLAFSGCGSKKVGAPEDLKDGTYSIEVTLGGGSGRANVESPAVLTVKDGKAVCTLVWSSKYYDYMIVDETQYDSVTREPGSTFEIPVTAFDAEIPVQADTTAMSMPHLIEYTLTFHSESVK